MNTYQNPLSNERFLEEAIHFAQQTVTDEEYVPVALLKRRDPSDPE